jgi:hypothetical protein
MKNLKVFSILFFLCFSPSIFAQQEEKMESEFNSVFQSLSTGYFTGTLNGVLFLKNSRNIEVILDFQGTNSFLSIEKEDEEVYDKSYKNYKGTTTSGKTSIEYSTYASANALKIKTDEDEFEVSTIDGACDTSIKGMDFYYKSEKDVEYLVLDVRKPIVLDNYNFLIMNEANSQKWEKIKREKGKTITLLPKSVLVFAIKR